LHRGTQLGRSQSRMYSGRPAPPPFLIPRLFGSVRVQNAASLIPVSRVLSWSARQVRKPLKRGGSMSAFVRAYLGVLDAAAALLERSKRLRSRQRVDLPNSRPASARVRPWLPGRHRGDLVQGAGCRGCCGLRASPARRPCAPRMAPWSP
jgi:hypothetical protein